MKNGSTTPENGTRWHDKYPHLGTGPLSVDVFTSPEQFAQERERIFKKVWLNVGRVEQIPHPGDYFVKNLAVCNTSVIVVRGKDNKVKAFHNMCSHRGNKIAWDQPRHMSDVHLQIPRVVLRVGRQAYIRTGRRAILWSEERDPRHDASGSGCVGRVYLY